MLTELRNRGVKDVCIVCCDGLKGLPELDPGDLAGGDRANLRRAPRAQLVAVRLDQVLETHRRRLREIYQAPTLAAAEARFEEFAERWQPVYPAMVEMWRRRWASSCPSSTSRSRSGN